MGDDKRKIPGRSGNTPVRHYTDIHFGGMLPKCLIVGKGPSYNPDTIRKYKDRGFILCAINEAWTGCDVEWDICCFIDWNVCAEFKDCANVRHFITVTKSINPDIDWMAAIPNSDKFRDKLYFFDGKHTRYFPRQKSITYRCSTSEALLRILIDFGACYIAFNGVDGTADHSPAFTPRQYKSVLAQQFQTFKELEEKHWLIYEGLPELYSCYNSVNKF